MKKFRKTHHCVSELFFTRSLTIGVTRMNQDETARYRRGVPELSDHSVRIESRVVGLDGSPPAEGVLMVDCGLDNEAAFGFQCPLNVLVRVLLSCTPVRMY